MGGDSRVTEHWLPLLRWATVLGRLERRAEGWAFEPDPQVGLLLSPHPPEQSARQESLKGWCGLIGAAAGVALVAWFCLNGAGF